MGPCDWYPYPDPPLSDIVSSVDYKSVVQLKAIKVSLIVWTIPVMVAGLVAALVSVTSAQNEPHVGKWELNLSMDRSEN